MDHLMSRGDRRERMFLDDVDRQDFFKALAGACQKTGWQAHAYCLMTNHHHQAVETPEPNWAAGMAWLRSAYTIRHNHRRRLLGHVFSGWYLETSRAANVKLHRHRGRSPRAGSEQTQFRLQGRISDGK